MEKHNQKHLTLSNRIYIEQELMQGSTFSSIAKGLHKDPTTISKEIKKNAKPVPVKYGIPCQICKLAKTCIAATMIVNCVPITARSVGKSPTLAAYTTFLLNVRL